MPVVSFLKTHVMLTMDMMLHAGAGLHGEAGQAGGRQGGCEPGQGVRMQNKEVIFSQ